MQERVQSRATYADLEAVPPHLTAEILDGELVTLPRPPPRHAVAANSLTTILTGPFQLQPKGPGGWIFMVEPELHIAEAVIVPDLAGWRRTRLTAMPAEVGITLAPDWVCEVLSDSTARHDRSVKLRTYHAARVGHVWFLDPRCRLLEVLRRQEQGWLVAGTFVDFAEVRIEPFEAIAFDLGLLWPFEARPEAAAKEVES